MKRLIFALIALSASTALSHGEDKLGPNGGYVRMPGAYHTEVVANGKNELKVFLLDMSWQNPSTKDSSVEIDFAAKAKNPIQCKSKENYFSCELPADINLQKKGKLVVKSQREGQKGNLATYPLPLTLVKASEDHSGHH